MDGYAVPPHLHILLIEGDPAQATLLREALARIEPEIRVTVAHGLRPALQQLATPTIGCVLTNLWLPDAEGIRIIRDLRAARPDVPVIVVTEAGSEELAVAALKMGAADYVSQHGRERGDLPAFVREALGRAVLAGLEDGSDRPQRPSRAGAGFIARSPSMWPVLVMIERAARSRAPVLLEGETGTGKEIVARAIHDCGPRQDAPFVVQNCAAIADSLLESELFGHLRGSFTGAERDRRGLFVEAGDGTVFLDEVADAPPAVQAKLLRVLQDHEVKAVGADRVQRVRARIIAATNRSLEAEVCAGRFRLDLYYRLAVLPIGLPPLRHRPADIPLLLASTLGRCEQAEGRVTGGFDPDAVRALQAYPWPGNVRELENEVQRLVLSIRQEDRIRRRHLARRIREAAPPAGGEPLDEILKRVEIATIQERVRQLPTKTAAARSLGITREALYGKMRRLGLPPTA